MIRFLLICILIVLIQSIALAQGTVVDTSFYSQALGFNREVDVYLPEGYDPDGDIDYPVIYFLHGAGGNSHSYPEIIDTLDALISSQRIQPLIMAKPNGYIGPYAGSMYTNSELYGDFEDFIIYDLVDFIESSFRIMPIRARRGLMGHSMGGIGSMKLALPHYDLYAGVASLSGALDMQAGMDLWIPHILSENGGSPPYNYTPFGGVFSLLAFTAAGAFSPNLDNPPYYVDFPMDADGNVIDSLFALWIEHSPAHLAASLPQDAGLSIYFDCGTNDYLEFYPMNTAFAESLDFLEIEYEFQTFDGDHFHASRLPISIMFLDSVLSLPTDLAEVGSTLPEAVCLYQNYPNPFNASTTIEYDLPARADVILEIFDILGRRVATVVNEFQQSGHHRVRWDASNFSSGIYFCKLQAGGYSQSKKMILMK